MKTMLFILLLCNNRINVYVDHKEAPTTQVFEAIRKHGMEKQVVIHNGVEELKAWK